MNFNTLCCGLPNINLIIKYFHLILIIMTIKIIIYIYKDINIDKDNIKLTKNKKIKWLPKTLTNKIGPVPKLPYIPGKCLGSKSKSFAPVTPFRHCTALCRRQLAWNINSWGNRIMADPTRLKYLIENYLNHFKHLLKDE